MADAHDCECGHDFTDDDKIYQQILKNQEDAEKYREFCKYQLIDLQIKNGEIVERLKQRIEELDDLCKHDFAIGKPSLHFESELEELQKILK